MPRAHLAWLAGLTGPPSSDEVGQHVERPDPELSKSLVGLAALLRQGTVVEEGPRHLLVQGEQLVRITTGEKGMIASISVTPGRVESGLSQVEAAARLYDHAAPVYEQMAAPLAYYWPTARKWLSSLGLERGTVYDIGCGPGHLTAELPTAILVCGTDVSPEMVRLASTRRPGGQFVVHDFHQPLPSDWPAADVMVALGCLDFAEDLGRVLSHLGARCLVGARALITVPRPAHGDAPGESSVPPFGLVSRTYDDSLVRVLLERAGFVVSSVRTIDGYDSPMTGLVRYGLWELLRQP